MQVLYVGADPPWRPEAGAESEGFVMEQVPDLEAARRQVGRAPCGLLVVDLRAGAPAGLEESLRSEPFDGCPVLLLTSTDGRAPLLDPQLLDQGRIELMREADCAAFLRGRIVDRSRTARQALRLQARLQEMQGESQAREGLVQKLVHDMKSPLTVMLIELGMLERWWEKSNLERFQAGVSRLTQNCEELIGMIQNLLDIHRIRQDQLDMAFTTIGLGTVLREVAENPPSILQKKGLEFHRDLRDSHTPVSMDPSMISRVLENLLNVAGRLSPPQGRVTLSSECRQGRMLVRVEAEGRTLSEEERLSLFDQYAYEKWRTLGLDAGLGIGLNLGRLLIEAHRGCLRVESGPGGGAALTVELPTADEEESSR